MGRWDSQKSKYDKFSVILGVSVLIFIVFVMMIGYMFGTPTNCDPTTGQCQPINNPTVGWNIQVNH